VLSDARPDIESTSLRPFLSSTFQDRETHHKMSRTDLQQSDSIEAEDPHNQEKKKQKSRRPASASPGRLGRNAMRSVLTEHLRRHCLSTTATEGMAVSGSVGSQSSMTD
jgi:hypothetical protein